MKFYHRTDHANAILEHGFIDGRGIYMTDSEHQGVFVADQPLDESAGARGLVVLGIEIPEDVLAPYEWKEEDKPYREFCAPAAILNEYGPPALHEVDFEGCSRSFLMKRVEFYQAGNSHDRAARLVKHIAFLEQHGLLGEG